MKFGLREIIVVFLLLLIPIGTWWLVLRPAGQRNEWMLEQITIKQTKLKELNQVTGTIGDLKSQIQSLERAIGYFQSKLPSEKEIDKVLKEVWLLAESNNLATKSIRTLQRPSDKGFAGLSETQTEQPIDMQIEGDFMGFYGFLQALENQPRIMRISKMNLKKIERSSEGLVRAEFSMSIFCERDRGRS